MVLLGVIIQDLCWVGVSVFTMFTNRYQISEVLAPKRKLYSPLSGNDWFFLEYHSVDMQF
jgi:hypothetical protein